MFSALPQEAWLASEQRRPLGFGWGWPRWGWLLLFTRTSSCSFPSKIRKVRSVWKPKGELVLLQCCLGRALPQGGSLLTPSQEVQSLGLGGGPVLGTGSLACVYRITGVYLTCAEAAARSELSKRRRTVQVRSTCPPRPHHPSPGPAGSGTLGFQSPISSQPSLPGHGLLFKTKLEKSLAWKGAQPRLQESQQVGPGDPGGFPEVGSALA